MLKRIYSTLFLSSCLCYLGISQKKYDKIDLQKNPVWIQMMDDSTTNYFEALNAFEIFWKDKILPLQEEDLFKETEKSMQLIENNSVNADSDYKKYAFEYKKFNYWKVVVIPFVQADGSILTSYQRIIKWQEQQK